MLGTLDLTHELHFLFSMFVDQSRQVLQENTIHMTLIIIRLSFDESTNIYRLMVAELDEDC